MSTSLVFNGYHSAPLPDSGGDCDSLAAGPFAGAAAQAPFHEYLRSLLCPFPHHLRETECGAPSADIRSAELAPPSAGIRSGFLVEIEAVAVTG